MIKTAQRDTLDIIKNTINKAVNLIKPTFGPSSNKVIISKQLYKMTVDDGVQIARDLEFEDPMENAVWQEAKHTAIRTNDRVGDGTTGALIMLQAIINEATKSVKVDGRKIEKELKKGLEEAKKQLLSMKHEIKTKEDLEKVARISFDDEKISKIIADSWYKLGKDGILTVDRSGTMETIADIANGIKIDRGYMSPYMITNDRMEGLIEKPYILLTDYRLTETNDILPIMNELVKKNINMLVVIAENIEQQALATIIVNKLQNKFAVVAVNAPLSGQDRTLFLEDIALMTGAKLFSESKGDKLEFAKVEDLGRADRFIARKDNSVIIGPRGNKKEIEKAVAELNSVINTSINLEEKKSLEKRLARLGGKIGVIKVGASTENEERALKYKVDDAIHAVLSAYKGGVVPGAGVALSSITTSSEILNTALQAPFRQLKENVGLDTHRVLNKEEAINVVTGKIGKFIEVGVMDPVEVLIAGVESAVSIASLLLTSSGMVVEVPEPEKK